MSPLVPAPPPASHLFIHVKAETDGSFVLTPCSNECNIQMLLKRDCQKRDYHIESDQFWSFLQNEGEKCENEGRLRESEQRREKRTIPLLVFLPLRHPIFAIFLRHILTGHNGMAGRN